MAKLLDKLTLYVGGLLAGGDILTSNRKDPYESAIVIQERKELGSKLMQSLLKKEVTQEVAELRWRMYMLDREMDKYTVVRDATSGELKSIKKHPDFTKPKVFEEKNKKVVIVQNTEPLKSGVDNGFSDGMKLHELHKIKQLYPLTFERGSISKCEFDKSCYQVVLKQNGKKRIRYYLDFYFHAIPDSYERTKRITTLELEKVFNKELQIDYLDEWNTVSFTTRNCWGVDSYINYKLECKKFVDIHKWGLFYVVQYEVKILEKTDNIQQYFEPEIQKRYDDNEPRPDRYVAHNITGDDDMGKDRECPKCGELQSFKNLEVADLQLTEATFGQAMCKKCLEEYLKNNNII